MLTPASLADMSLEDLANLRVTTAALRPERFLQTPASIFVITNEDIRRSGATSLPEALRLAPNLLVAQVGAASYAVSARGFQNVITNKLLVLVDGRMLYTAVLSGVLWDAQDVMLEDVERIEVISGPGAALHGANAFVGVINVITRSAADTRGAAAVANVGRNHRDVAARAGARIGDALSYRVYAMHIERDNLRPAASRVVDSFDKNQAGFRADHTHAGGNFTLQGDVYRASLEGNSAATMRLEGANLLGRWTRTGAHGEQLRLQAYYDYTLRNDPATFVDRLHLFDVESQVDLAPLGNHRISFGLGYRHARDDTTPNPVVRFIPEDRTLRWWSLVAQDEITVSPELSLLVGGKVQTNVYARTQFMPDVRLDWHPTRQSVLWVAASAVARTPGRIDRDFHFPGNEPFFIRGGPDFKPERGRVLEVGYRSRPVSSLTYSVTLFHAWLDDLRGGRPAPQGGLHLSNEIEGTTKGLEAWAMWQATPRWRLMLGILELDQDLRPKPGSTDLAGPPNLGNDPRHTLKARCSMRLSDEVDFDLSWRYVSKLSYLQTVPSYHATDVRLAWRPSRNIELAIGGRDIFSSGHVEFDEHGFPARIPRSAYAQVRAQF